MKLTRFLPPTLQVVLLVISTDPCWHNFANSKTVPDVTVFIKSFTCLICLVNMSTSLALLCCKSCCMSLHRSSLIAIVHTYPRWHNFANSKTDPDVAVFMPSTPYKVTCPDLFDMLKKLLHVVTKLRKSSLIAASIA